MTPREVLELRHRSLGLDTAARLQGILYRDLGKTEVVATLAARNCWKTGNGEEGIAMTTPARPQCDTCGKVMSITRR